MSKASPAEGGRGTGAGERTPNGGGPHGRGTGAPTPGPLESGPAPEPTSQASTSGPARPAPPPKPHPFLDFCQSIRQEALFFLLINLVYFLVAFANRLPYRFFLYSLFLSLALGLAWAWVRYARFKEVWEALEALDRYLAAREVQARTAPEALAGDLILPKDAALNDLTDPLAQKWAAISQALLRERNRESLAMAHKRKELEEIYTLWLHQVKTPLAAIRLLLDRGGSEEEIKGQLLEIDRELDLLLAYLKKNLETTDYVFEVVELGPLIRGLIHKYAPIFISKGIACRYEGSDLVLISDKKWLAFILDQLLSNALKYTETGYIQIETQPGSITVTDTGLGIAPEDLPRIFEMGYTGQNGHRMARSTGIGLYLVQSIADQLNMTVSVTSSPGQGSTFSLHKPYKKVS